jgi:hypothetical protein
MRPLLRVAGTAAFTIGVVIAANMSHAPAARPAAHPAANEGDLDPNDPVIAACTATQVPCDPEALAEDALTTPYYSPLAAGTELVTEAAATSTALTQFGAPETAPHDAHLTTGAVFETATGVTRTHGFDGTRPIWVVHVVAPVETDGSPAGPGHTEPEYSVVLDAGTGGITDYCLGCNWNE